MKKQLTQKQIQTSADNMLFLLEQIRANTDDENMKKLLFIAKQCCDVVKGTFKNLEVSTDVVSFSRNLIRENDGRGTVFTFTTCNE